MLLVATNHSRQDFGCIRLTWTGEAQLSLCCFGINWCCQNAVVAKEENLIKSWLLRENNFQRSLPRYDCVLPLCYFEGQSDPFAGIQTSPGTKHISLVMWFLCPLCSMNTGPILLILQSSTSHWRIASLQLFLYNSKRQPNSVHHSSILKCFTQIKILCCFIGVKITQLLVLILLRYIHAL